MKSFELISKITLSTLNISDFDIQMNTILEILGQFTKVSRTYIFIDNEKGTSTSNKYEWCNTGIEPQINELQEVPYEIIPSWRKILHENGKVFSENISELPEDIVAILQPQGILSIIVYPIYILGKMKGFVGFDECSIIRKWSEADLNLLSSISNIISNRYENNLILERLSEEKFNLENFINTINDFVIIGNLSGDIVYTNKAVIKELGYSKDELLKMNIIELHPLEKRDEASIILNSMFKGELDLCPIELAGKGGTIIPVETRIWFGKWNNQDSIFGLSKNLSKEQEALQKFTKLFDNNPALMAVTNLPERKFVDVNKSFIENIGYSYDEIIGKTSIDLGLFVESEKQSEIAVDLQKNKRIQNIELQVRCKNENILDGLFSGEIIESQGKKYFLTVMVDITEQKNLQNLYNTEKTRLSCIINGTQQGTWEWNVQTGETIFNEMWAEIIGYTLSELEPLSIETWIKNAHPDDLKNSNQLLEKHFKGELNYYDVECRMKHKNGQWIWVHDRGKVIKWDEEGKPLMMYGTHTDITEKKEIQDKIKELSIRDPLTNAYNRRYIFERLEKELLRFKRTNNIFSISILDIDFFKNINDTYGHQAGDYILKEFTTILFESIRESDLLGRYGGEEFIIITYDSNKEKTAIFLDRILDNIRSKTFVYKKSTIVFTFSSGVCDTSEIDKEIIDIGKIISIADQRLYFAKNNGRNRVVIYDNN